MRQKIFITLIGLLCALSAFSERAYIDGVLYNLNLKAKTAEVTSAGYSGEVTIPSSITHKGVSYQVTSIGSEAFYNCSSLRSVTIPNSVTSIEVYAFYNCTNLTSVTIPNSVTSIGYGAFMNCSGLTSLTIPNSVTSIGSAAFSNVPNIVYNGAVTGGSAWGARSVNGIVDGWLVYSNNTKTTLLSCSSAATGEITIPNSVTSIGASAFCDCKYLTSIEIPNSVTSIGINAFLWCSGLTSINVSQGNPNYCSDNGVLFNKNKMTLVQYPMGKSGNSYIIPNSVTSIGYDAFSYCTNLTSVTIPNSVTSIGRDAFSHCTNLTSVTIPNSVTSIGYSAFFGCSGLTSVAIPNSVTSIGGFAFSGCSSLTSIEIPNSVTSIGDNIFYNCGNLKVRTASCASLANAGIPAERVIRISEDEALTDYAKANPNQIVVRQKISEPANLTYVDGSLHFTDVTGNKAIDANETCHIRFKIRNDGKGEARNCKAKVTLTGSQSGITVQTITVPTIAPQKSVDLDIPVSANMQTKDGNATFTIEITEPNGFGTDPMELTVATKAFVSPYLRIVDYSVTSSSGTSKLEKKRPFNLQLMLQNTQYGKAENVVVELKFPEGVFLMDGDAKTTFATLDGGKAQSLDYEMVVNNNYASNQIPVQVILKEKYGKYAESRTINLEINQMLSSSKLNIHAVEQNNRPEIQLATIGSDVDKNIPTTNQSADNTFALIIANENYQEVADVPFALNDGNIFRLYCIKTLGISEEHIRYVPNATGNKIKSQINWLSNITEAWNNPQIIIYYAGHGIPDENNMSSYILPVDGSGTDVTTGYKLDDLYTTLGNMPASQITVFMDACFSGSKREDGMLASARGVALKAKSGVPQGNMVVFSAAQGDETAYPNREEQHGMFTYYLLKKLQETGGDIDLKTLGDYITQNVSRQSLLINNKKQTPTVTPSATIGIEWQGWKLK